MPSVVLVGMMASGKSTVGELLGAALALEFIDLDELIVEKKQMSVGEIFEKYGESEFRRVESALLEQVLNSVASAVIALGGGALMAKENRTLLRSSDSLVIGLVANAAEIIRRVGNSEETGKRPMLDMGDLTSMVATRMKEREPGITECSQVIVDTSGKTPNEVVSEIKNICRDRLGL